MKQLPESRMLKFAALLAILIMTLLPGKALAASFTIGSLTYTTLFDGSVEVRAAAGSSLSGDITIPATITFGWTEYRVTSIASYAFSGCTYLTSVTIPDGVTSIMNEAFSGCSSLISVTIHDSVTTIGPIAFANCTSLTSITIPESVTSIGWGAFGGCSSLTSVTIPKNVTSIGAGVFNLCSSLTSVTIQEGVISTGEGMFGGCTSLTSVTIPESLTSIGEGTFSGCTSLTSILIPEGVTSIGASAFRGCSVLEPITIPGSVTSIGANAFDGCYSMTVVTCLAITPPSLASNAFESIYSFSKALYVPAGTLEDYKASDWRKYFNIIEEIPLGGIDEVPIADEKPQIVINGNSIEIHNLNDAETISIFTTDGACVYQGKNHSVSLAPNKVYVLHTARGILKFAL